MRWKDASVRRPVGQRSREAEPCDHAVVEAGDRAHLVPGQGDDEEAEDVGDAGSRVLEVDAEGRLPVCPGRDEAVAAAMPEGDGGEEPAGELLALVLKRYWWHPYPCVFGHELSSLLVVVS